MENYMMGFSTGLILGVAIALPGPNDVTTSLTREEMQDLQRGRLSEEFRHVICKKFEAELEKKIDKPEDVSICGRIYKSVRQPHQPL